jgi:uncharacterized membrane protein YvbJ
MCQKCWTKYDSVWSEEIQSLKAELKRERERECIKHKELIEWATGKDLVELIVEYKEFKEEFPELCARETKAKRSEG